MHIYADIRPTIFSVPYIQISVHKDCSSNENKYLCKEKKKSDADEQWLLTESGSLSKMNEEGVGVRSRAMKAKRY